MPPALAAVGGKVEIHGSEGTRRVATESLYSGDGLDHLTLEVGEIVTGVILPWPDAPSISAYGKARLRRAVDRPLVGVAIALEMARGREIRQLRIATCGSGPKVELVDGLEAFVGARMDSRVIDAIGRSVFRSFQPSPALRVDIGWRRHLARTLTRRGLGEIGEMAERISRPAATPPGLPG